MNIDELTIDMTIDMARFYSKVKTATIMEDNPELTPLRNKYMRNYRLDEDTFMDHYCAICVGYIGMDLK